MSQENDWWIEHHFGSGTIEAPSEKRQYIYESPDKGKTIYRREFGKLEREPVSRPTQG